MNLSTLLGHRYHRRSYPHVSYWDTFTLLLGFSFLVKRLGDIDSFFIEGLSWHRKQALIHAMRHIRFNPKYIIKRASSKVNGLNAWVGRINSFHLQSGKLWIATWWFSLEAVPRSNGKGKLRQGVPHDFRGEITNPGMCFIRGRLINFDVYQAQSHNV